MHCQVKNSFYYLEWKKMLKFLRVLLISKKLATFKAATDRDSNTHTNRKGDCVLSMHATWLTVRQRTLHNSPDLISSQKWKHKHSTQSVSEHFPQGVKLELFIVRTVIGVFKVENSTHCSTELEILCRSAGRTFRFIWRKRVCIISATPGAYWLAAAIHRAAINILSTHARGHWKELHVILCMCRAGYFNRSSTFPGAFPMTLAIT